MARRAIANAEGSDTSPDSTDAPHAPSVEDLPEGFHAVNTGGGKQLWCKPEPGRVIIGELLGRFERRSGKRGFFYQLKLENHVTVNTTDEEGNKLTDVDAGPDDVINVDEKTSMEDLARYATSGKRWRLWIKYVAKETLKSGNSFWRVRVGAMEIQEGSKAPSL